MSTDIQRHEDRYAGLKGTFTDSADVTKRMDWAARHVHLVSPATTVGQLPAGCAVSLSMVSVNADLDTYSTGAGKFGLSKSVLQQLGHALGVSWDPVMSTRLDDGSDPYYCRWRAVGTYRAFDGQVQTLLAEKELDLRDGSAVVEGMRDQRKQAGKPPPDNQIREMRMHIQSHAETKAQLRAIRSLGIKTGYTKAELAKPFVAARVMFTGETSDPELRREFARMTAQSFLSGQAALYGRAAVPETPAPADAPRLAPPPPVGTTRPDADDMPPPLPPHYDADAPTTGRHARPAAAASPPAPASGEASGWVIPGGKSKGQPIEQASERDLQYWAGRFKADLDGGTSRDAARDQDMLDAFEAELARRDDGGGY